MKNVKLILLGALLTIAAIAMICIMTFCEPPGSSNRKKAAAENRERIDRQKIAKRMSLKERQALAGPPPPPSARAQSATEAWVEECLREGAFHSVNVEFNEVRIAPFLWSLFTIEQKQNVVARLSKYFDSKGGTGRVNILSNRNDNKLATYSVWSGVKIIE